MSAGACGRRERDERAERGLSADQYHRACERVEPARLYLRLVSLVALGQACRLTSTVSSGGGYDSGSASDPKVDGSYLAAKVCRRGTCL